MQTAIVSRRGALRWARGHPWIFRSDVQESPATPAGIARVADPRGKPLGVALWSPTSEIALRLLDRDPDAPINAEWWRQRLHAAIQRRAPLAAVSNACRLVHAEADGLPSLVCDRYDRWLVIQLLSAGIEHFRVPIVETLAALTGAEGILGRHDVAVRAREGLPQDVELLYGRVPDEIELVEHGVRSAVSPRAGQKTGAFLDQRDNRQRVGEIARGAVLDCFCYEGAFALHAARASRRVTAVDASGPALERARDNARRNGFGNIEFVEANVFEFLRGTEREGGQFDTIVLDPPAFAKSRAMLRDATRGYKEVNLRAMRLLTSGGRLFTASCSYHLSRALFLEMLQAAAADSGRRMALLEVRGQPLDHPDVLTIPETGYLKGAILEALD
jgi:23S rRNA (cytosine1962-C5)-methyltransferase